MKAARFAPRALLRRSLIDVGLTPLELSILIRALETRAMEAAESEDQVDFAQFLFDRVAELREAFR